MIGALPLMISPPQSARPRSPMGWSLLNTIGASAVPLARIWAPRAMMRVPLVANSPKISVPASMVSRAGASMKTAPRSTQ